MTETTDETAYFEEVARLATQPLENDERQLVDIGDGEALGYLQVGPDDAANTLLLLPGLLCSAHSWKALYTLPVVRAVPNWRIVALEYRGFGKSTHKQLAQSHEETGADVVKAIEKLGLQSIIVVGWSTGGPPAIEVAATLGPERVVGLVFHGAVCVDGLTAVLPSSGPVTTKEQAREFAEFFPMLASSREQDATAFARHWRQLVCPRKRPSVEELAVIVRGGLEQTVEAFYSMTWCNVSYRGREAAKKVKCPTIVMHGDEDAALPIADAHKNLDAFENVHMVTIIGGTHDPMVDGADQIGAALVALMKKVGRD